MYCQSIFDDLSKLILNSFFSILGDLDNALSCLVCLVYYDLGEVSEYDLIDNLYNNSGIFVCVTMFPIRQNDLTDHLENLLTSTLRNGKENSQF